MQVFNYTDSDFIKDSGMAIDTQPITIQGRVLEAPTIEYGRGQSKHEVFKSAHNALNSPVFAPWGTLLAVAR